MTTETPERRPRSIEEVSAYIHRRNWPKERKALIWRKIDERRSRSHCNRFQVERRGEGEATRYFAFILPTTVIGHRLASLEQAKEVCERHASPLPLEPPQAEPAPQVPPIEREPGSDDEL